MMQDRTFFLLLSSPSSSVSNFLLLSFFTFNHTTLRKKLFVFRTPIPRFSVLLTLMCSLQMSVHQEILRAKSVSDGDSYSSANVSATQENGIIKDSFVSIDNE